MLIRNLKIYHKYLNHNVTLCIYLRYAHREEKQ